MENENLKVKGVFRLQITEDGKGVVGDSGWCENQVTNLGIRDYLVYNLVGDTANRKTIGFMAVGTGGVPASNATTLGGEVVKRAAVSSSVISSRTAQFTASFMSSASFVTTTVTVNNIGLFNSSSTGVLFSGNTFATSSLATNQQLEATYQIRIS